MTPDWNSIRAEFPSLSRWTYLNTATIGQVPERAVRAMQRHLDHRVETACQDFLTWFEDHDQLRHRVAAMFQCSASEVAFVQNAASAFALLLRGIHWKEGDEIVTLAGEFPNQIYHPAFLGNSGTRLHEVEWKDFHKAVNPRTRLIALSTVNYVTGFRPPLEEIANAARRVNALLYLDGTQSAGALRFSWPQIQPDIFAVNAYKWMLTPNGVGFMLVHPRVREWLQPHSIGWRSDQAWREVDALHHGAPRFVNSADKYEGGMLPSLQLYALEGTLSLLEQLGMENVENRVLELAARTREVLRQSGASLLYDNNLNYESPIIAAQWEGRDSSAISKELREREVLVSARHGYLRVSPHFYNTEADLERLASVLCEL